MGQRRKGGASREEADQQMRDQEVLRANRELAAYFKGQRTEREARAALKIIKAFVRDRERLNAASRPPLPGLAAPKASREPAKRKATGDRGEGRRRKAHRMPQPKRVAAVLPLREALETAPESSGEPSTE